MITQSGALFCLFVCCGRRFVALPCVTDVDADEVQQPAPFWQPPVLLDLRTSLRFPAQATIRARPTASVLPFCDPGPAHSPIPAKKIYSLAAVQRR
jgi:hypothetical protein